MKKRVIYTLFAFVLFSIPLLSQTEITGLVIDGKDNQPLVGAQIVLKNGKGSVTDERGYFNITTDKIRDTIRIKYLGYIDEIMTVTVDKSALGTIELDRSSTTLNEIVVSASPHNFKKGFKGSNYRINPASL